MRAAVLVCDALPLTLLGPYGCEWVETPHLDRLAHGGFTFDQCFPERPGAHAWGRAVFEGDGGDVSRLATALQRERVATAFFSDFHAVGNLPRWATEFDQCRMIHDAPMPPSQWATLEEVAGCGEYLLPPPDHPQSAVWAARWRRQWAVERWHGDSATRSAETLFAAAADWFARQDGAALLWIELALATASWLPPTSYRNQHLDQDAANAFRDPMPGSVGAVYRAADLERIRSGWADRVAYFDAMLGAFLEMLADGPQDRGDFFALTANQGYPLGEHGWVGVPGGGLYTEVAQVPLIIRCPGGRATGRSFDLVQAADLGATLCEAFGVVAPTADGRSLLPMLRGAAPSPGREHAMQTAVDDTVLITPEWKLRVTADRRSELYRKPADRFDVNDLAGRNREELEAMTQLLTTLAPEAQA